LIRKQLFWLSDEEWGRVEPLLPKGRRGARRVGDRRVISGIIHRNDFPYPLASLIQKFSCTR
jgi:hypothetical protein